MDTTSLTKRLKIEIDGWPSLGGREMSKKDIRNIKEILGLKEEIIKAFGQFPGFSLFLYFGDFILFTNYAIYIKDIQNTTVDIIRWWEITKVSYENEHFMFFNSEGKNFKSINVGIFFPKGISISTGVDISEGLAAIAAIAAGASVASIAHSSSSVVKQKEFSEGLTSVASIAPNPLQLAQENKYSEAIEAVNYYITIESSIELYVTRAFIYYDRAIKSNDNKNLLQEALTEIEKTIDHCKDHEECWELHKYKGHILELMGKTTNSRNAYMKSLAEAPEEQKYELQNRITKLEKANTDLWNNYVLKVPYKERKYIMLVEDSKIKNCAVSGITIFKSSNVPDCINFYDNMPLNNELYVGHPYNPSVYIPYYCCPVKVLQDKKNKAETLLQDSSLFCYFACCKKR